MCLFSARMSRVFLARTDIDIRGEVLLECVGIAVHCGREVVRGFN